MSAKSPKLPEILTLSWVVGAIARLGGYLEHRHKTLLVFSYCDEAGSNCTTFVKAGSLQKRLNGKSQHE